MDSLTGQTLFKADGSSALADDVLSGKDLVLYYFSAHWCPPCRQFTPVLKEFYEIVKDSGIEIVFVSSDKSPGDMVNYMKESHGDWYSVKHSSPLAVQLKEKYGMSAEIIDARSLVPFNYEPVIESVKKTGRIILTSDACSRGSYLKDMAETVTELAFDYLDAPPVVVGSRNWITPSYEQEEYFFPQADWLVDAIHEKIIPLKGHQPKNNFTNLEQIDRNQKGV